MSLRLSLLAYRLLLEEYPQAASQTVQEDAHHWRLDTDVASYVGISRFVLGLFDEIEVVAGDGLRDYLHKRIARMTANL